MVHSPPKGRDMGTRESVKPITYMKTHAADILATVSETHRPIIITHNGEGKMVIQDIESYQAMKEAIAFLKIAALARQSVERGKVKPARKAFDAIARRRKRRG
jgi:prevent-host-death family protein